MKTAILLSLLIWTSSAQAYISDEAAPDIVLNNAADGDYDEMYALACAIRNADRKIVGKSNGFASFYSEVTGRQSRETIASDYFPIFYRMPNYQLSTEQYTKAFKAWRASERGRDVTDGAWRWHAGARNGNYISEIPKRDEHLMKMEKTAEIGRFEFYR